MAKKKNNKNAAINQAYILDKQRKEYFWKSFKDLINLIGEDDLYSLIPEHIKTLLYNQRFYALQIKYPKDFPLSKQEKHDLELIFKNFQETHFVEIENKKFKIDVATFSTTLLSIFNLVKPLEDSDFSGAAKIKNKLMPIVENKDYWLEYYKNIFIICNTASMAVNRIDRIYHLKQGSNSMRKSDWGAKYQIIDIEEELPEKRKIKINNETHVAYKFGGIFLSGFEWFTVNLETFLPKSKQKIFDVFMQKHVVNRFSERIDYGANRILIYTLFVTFLKPVMIKYKGLFLLEYSDRNVKLGYFAGTVVEDIFLIKTFLFITNNGTPEGDKLNELLKINRNDKDYLAINKLSTFLKMNSQDVDEIKDLFAAAGCETLFDMRSKLDCEIFELDEQPYQGKIKNYLAVDNSDDFTFFDDESEQNINILDGEIKEEVLTSVQ